MKQLAPMILKNEAMREHFRILPFIAILCMTSCGGGTSGTDASVSQTASATGGPPTGGTGSASWPFDNPQYLLLNLAIGGDMGGPVDNSIFPVQMAVDYVRVYQKL